MTRDEISTSVIEKYFECVSKDLLPVPLLTSYLEELTKQNELYDFLVNLDEDNRLFIYLKKSKIGEIYEFEVKSYFREQRFKKILDN